MGEDLALSLGSDAIKMIIIVAGPLLAAALVIGLIVSVLQAVTQINESTLTFIPKMIAILVVMAVMAPWMLENLQEYTTQIFTRIPEWIH